MDITNSEVSTESNSIATNKNVECPFTWELTGLLVKESSNIIERLLEKEDIAEEYNAQFKCSIFVVQLLLSYELYNLGNTSEALRRIEWCEHALAALDGSGCREPFYMNMRRPMWHVTLATHSIMTRSTSNQFQEQQVDERYNLTRLTTPEKACLYGLKSMCFLEYGFNGNMAALKWAKLALETDPGEAEWHFLTSKCMGRVRRCTKKFSGVPREEVELIERAVAISPNPKYIMYVAQVYQQSASAAFIHHRDDQGFYNSNLYRAINNMNKKAVELYQFLDRQALVFRPNCSYTYIRCLNGLLKLPRKYLNMTQIREMVDKVTQISPNNTMFLHTVGLHYLKMDADPKKALKYLERASEQGNYGASMDAIRLRFRMNENYNPIRRLNQLIEKFTAEPHHEDAVTQLGSFYLFIVRDLEKAIKAYNTIIEKNPESRAMLIHKPIFIRMTRPVNLYELLVNEVKIYEVKSRHLDSKLKENFLAVIAQHFPHLLERELDTQMIHRIIRDHRRMARNEMRRQAIFRRMLSTQKPKKVKEK